MKLSIKLCLAFGVLLVLIFTLGAFCSHTLASLKTDIDNVIQNAIPSIKIVSDIQSSLNSVRRSELQHIITVTDENMTEEGKVIEKSMAQFATETAKYESLISSNAERHVYTKMMATVETYFALLPRILTLSRAMKKDEAHAISASEARTLFRAALRDLSDLVALNDKASAQTSHHAEDAAKQALVVSLVLMFVSLGLGLSATILILRSTRAQLGEDPGYLHAVLQEIAAGNLAVPFRKSRHKGVYAAVQHMVAVLKAKIAEAEEKSRRAAAKEQQAVLALHEAEQACRTAKNVRREGMLHAALRLEGVGDVIASVSEELAARIEQSDRGAEEQAQRVAETATAMEEMNAAVLEVARNAGRAADTSDDARRMADEGATLVHDVVEGIVHAQRHALALQRDMQELGRQAQSIGQIMNVIADIADQTDLLALNATGKGFARVADDIRKLAEKTAQAKQEVAAAISGIQQSAQINMQHANLSVETIEHATALAHRSGKTLGSIVRLVDASSDQIRGIATASEQQSAASEEIRRTVGQAAVISTETAYILRQAGYAVGEMSTQARMLRQLVGELKEA